MSDHIGTYHDTRGFARITRRADSKVVCTIYKTRWHGFARYEITRRWAEGNTEVIEQLEEGWMRRRKDAPLYAFGPTEYEIDDDVLVDNR